MKPTNSTWPWPKPQASGHTVTTWVPLRSTSVGCGAIVEDALTSDRRLRRHHRSPTRQHQDNIMATKGPQLRFSHSLLAGQSRRDSRRRSRQGAGGDFGTVRESRGPANRGFDRRPRRGSVIAVRSIAQHSVGRCAHRGQRSRARRGAGNIQRPALPRTQADHRPRSLSHVIDRFVRSVCAVIQQVSQGRNGDTCPAISSSRVRRQLSGRAGNPALRSQL